MKLNKTETKLMNKFDSRESYNGRVSTFGKRENNAARSLEKKGLVVFVNQSEYIPPQRSNIRRQNGDYVGFFVTQGYIEKV